MQLGHKRTLVFLKKQSSAGKELGRSRDVNKLHVAMQSTSPQFFQGAGA